MFIIPVGNRVDWKRPPVVTLLLILVNCFVFFFLQAGDDRQDARATDYYYSSQLPNWEFGRYQEYLEKNDRADASSQFGILIKKRNTSALNSLENDAKFMQELHAGKIVTPQTAEFSDWSAQRNEYESMRSFTSRYVYQLGQPSPVNAFTSAFMHASFDHLLGNMVVLFLVGFLVEMVIGKALFALAYIVSIYAAIFMFGLTAPSDNNLLGASGAIAGMMGLYTVVFGFRKIDFFYSLGFYFDYVRAPAIALLPLWLGNELYQFFSGQDSHVAYMAHFGGLLCGATMGALYRLLHPTPIKQYHATIESNEIDSKTFQRGMDFLSAMEFKKAMREFKTLQQKYPHDTNLLLLTFRAAKFEPSSDDYHHAALKLLSLDAMDAATSGQTHNVFLEYLKCAKPSPRLEADLIVKLAKRFAVTNQCDDAEKLAIWLRSTAPQHSEIPAVLLALANGFRREKRNDKMKQILQVLIHKFPQTKEAEVAAGLLRMS